jgi:hypothetical protein
MLVHGVPWQIALAQAFVSIVLCAVLVCSSLVLGLFGMFPIIGGLMLILALVVTVSLIPLFMNLSRSYFTFLLCFLGIQVFLGVIYYALQFSHGGILDTDKHPTTSFGDGFYFSITTWTTLGCADFTAAPKMRLATAFEALTGVFSMAIVTSFIWLWCTENLVPKEKALFDGNRRHKKSLTIHRMRIRTLTGKPRNLGSEWVDPPKPGESYRYNTVKEEWEKVEKLDDLQDGDQILEKEKQRLSKPVGTPPNPN